MIKYIPVSVGELIDKISILEIKQKHIKNKTQLKNVNHELSMLLLLDTENIVNSLIYKELKTVNESLWDIEDRLRKYESIEKFDGEFITAARNVYKLNDQRAAIKRQINIQYESELIEEKSYDWTKNILFYIRTAPIWVNTSVRHSKTES
jgi:hypothetical protein